jgi:hypothetical protein
MDYAKSVVLLFLAIFTLLNASNPVFADTVPDQERKCRMVEKFSLSLYYQNTLKKDTDLGLFFKNKISTIHDIAAKLKLNHYKIVTQNMSINPSAYENNMVEVSTSLSIEIPMDYKVINRFYFESKAYTASVDLFETEVCEDKQ